MTTLFILLAVYSTPKVGSTDVTVEVVAVYENAQSCLEHQSIIDRSGDSTAKCVKKNLTTDTTTLEMRVRE